MIARLLQLGWPAVIVLFVFAGCCIDCQAQAPTPKERQSVKRITSNIDRAGKLFVAKKLDESQKLIEEAMKQIGEASAGARTELIELIKPDYDRLKKAHQLLADAGQKLPALSPLPEPVAVGMGVSFKSSVAPILVAKCGNCHVTRNRGNFSAATFEALENSTMLAYGLPQDSRLIQVIESGEMPKGGGKVEPDELQILKDWIQQGAKYDGQNRQQSLMEFVNADDIPAQPTAEPAAPTGKETVSFALHIAPILLENCGQCHINNNPLGNLNMGSFRRLLTGGDGGSPITPGKANESFIFKRIEAGEMPPTGKLDAKLIALIGKWLDEGAKYDGGDPQLEISIVASKAKADSQTHEQLAAARQELSAQTWKLVMNGVEAMSLPSENFRVTGSTSESRLTDVSKMLEAMVPKIASALRAETSTPLVKGNISVFVFDKRYDFSEFGKMVEQRDFPKEISGHWGYTTVDAYATVLMTRNDTAESVKVLLAKQIAAIHVASLGPNIPRWFADGVGYWTTKKVFAREDETRSWDSDALAAAQSMSKPDDFIKNQMPSDQAALVSYLFVKGLKSDGARFNRLLSSLQDGSTFEKAFVQAYGATPEQMFGSLGDQRGR